MDSCLVKFIYLIVSPEQIFPRSSPSGIRRTKSDPYNETVTQF